MEECDEDVLLAASSALYSGSVLGLAAVMPATAEPTGRAAIVVERLMEQVTYQTLVLQNTKAELIAYGAAVRENNPHPSGPKPGRNGHALPEAWGRESWRRSK